MAASDVDAYLARSDHPQLAGVRALRAAILAAEPRLVERVKWNAPSFAIDGDDLVTMRLAPRNAFQLVFHRGVVPRAGAVEVPDPGGLLDWRAPDRAVVDVRTTERARELEPAVVALVRAWVAAAG